MLFDIAVIFMFLCSEFVRSDLVHNVDTLHALWSMLTAKGSLFINMCNAREMAILVSLAGITHISEKISSCW